MTPEISEFSYGFALTNELVGWAPVAAAPLFPSLIEEGKAGGGYDVALDFSGVALYLQFKRADCMVRGSVQEIKSYGLPINLPFYRFKITESGKSDQHELLLALEEQNNLVFYAAPRFHLLNEINDAWGQNRVAERSIFLSPKVIGSLDDKSHRVAYDNAHAWLCSDPRPVELFNSRQVLEKINAMLSIDERPLRSKLPEMLANVEAAKERASARLAERRGSLRYPVSLQDTVSFERRSSEVGVPLRESRSLSDDEGMLRKLADEAAKSFSTQLIIVQPKAAVAGVP